MKRKSAFVPSMLTLIGGAAVGAGLGILFAPSKGKVTRKRISRKADYAMKSAKDKFGELRESVDQLMDKETAMLKKYAHKFA